MSRPYCDVIIPVYNSLSQTKRCVESVRDIGAGAEIDYRLILVNDASDSFTTSYLRSVAEADPERILLLENERNRGFLHTANRGLLLGAEGRDAEPYFKLLLNSDTIVSEGWLDSFKRCFDSDSRIALATPVSNNAENLSIQIPQGSDMYAVSDAVRKISPRFPDVTTAIGFCMGIRSESLRTIGVFDEVFSPGYAEDSDLHFRALCYGFRSVLVDNCFIFHESHASFAQSKPDLVAKNRPVFDQRWKAIYMNELKHHDARNPNAEAQRAADSTTEVEYDVLFVLPTSRLYGGIIVPYEIINRLLARGLKANAVILTEPEEIKMSLLFTPIFRPQGTWDQARAPRAKVYVSTLYATVPYCYRALSENPSTKLLYLIQGYEGWFPDVSLQEVVHTYRSIPNRVCVSQWLASMVGRWDCPSTVIPNGVDSLFFVPGTRGVWSDSTALPQEKVRMLLLLREDPQRSWEVGVSLLERLQNVANLELVGVGPASVRSEAAALCDECHGELDRKGMARLLKTVDIFVDCSVVQGFGLMGLEAMSCGAAVVLTNTGGVREYADDTNSILCPVGDVGALQEGVLSLVRDHERRATLQRAGRITAMTLDWEGRADKYHQLFTSLISSGADVGTDEALEIGRYLFDRHEAERRQTSQLGRACQILLTELMHTTAPRGALDLLSATHATALMDTLQKTREGQMLLAMYEQSRVAIERSAVAGMNAAASGMTIPGKRTALLEAVVHASRAIQ